MSSQINRRNFIRTSAIAAGGLAAGLGGQFLARAEDADAIKETRSHNTEMEYRRLGNTGLWVSAVCLGGHWKQVDKVIGHKIPAVSMPAAGPGRDALLKNRYDVLTRCMERGINYVDACTEGEIAAYGPALKDRRDQMYMGFAMWPKCPRSATYRKAEVLIETLDNGLKAAKVEYVDVWRLVAGEHNEADEQEFIKAFEIAKKQGKVRFTGVSSHNRKWLTRLTELFPQHFQVVLFPYTSKTKELPEDSLFGAVRKHDIGTFGIKPFASGSLFSGAEDPEEKNRRARLTIRYILGNPAITAPIPGMATPEEVDNMALAVKERRELDKTETAELNRLNHQMWANLPQEYQWLKEWEYV